MPWGATRIQYCAQAESVVILKVKINKSPFYTWRNTLQICCLNREEKKNKKAGKNKLWETSNFSISFPGSYPAHTRRDESEERILGTRLVILLGEKEEGFHLGLFTSGSPLPYYNISIQFFLITLHYKWRLAQAQVKHFYIKDPERVS